MHPLHGHEVHASRAGFSQFVSRARQAPNSDPAENALITGEKVGPGVRQMLRADPS